MKSRIEPLIVNFGGPRDGSEVFPFLSELLCDRDVVRTKLPNLIHNYLFRRIAKKRSLRIQKDYEEIGGGSPIYFDTENLGKKVSGKIGLPVLTFHRYLPQTHADSLKKIEESSADLICVFPLFPQFCYATTGSIARFFQDHLSMDALQKLRWIKSYAAHPSFISSYQRRINGFLMEKQLDPKDCVFVFSAHGIPVDFVEKGDPYQTECELSFRLCLEGFPKALGYLTYQSKFGKGEWLSPATDQFCRQILSVHQGRQHIVLIPITFTSDHIETLFEIEKLYLPLLQDQGLFAYRCPALNLEDYWVDGVVEILQETSWYANPMLVRKH